MGELIHDVAQGIDVEDAHGSAVDLPDDALIGESAQGPGECFAGEVEMAGDVALDGGQDDLMVGPVGGVEQVVCEPTDGVAQDDVFEQADQLAHPSSHALEELAAELMIGVQGAAEGEVGQQDALGGLDGLGERGAGHSADRGDLGEGHAGLGEVQDMFLAGGSDFVDADGARADDEHAGAGVAFAEYGLASGVVALLGHCGQAEDGFGIQLGEQAATADH